MTASGSRAARLLHDHEESARSAGLHYVDDHDPGISRASGRGKRFRYLDEGGRELRDATALARIDALRIPPAWTDVWICTDPRGHIQATGRDARGRKQYRYHDRWRDVRDATKFEKILDFAAALPELRARVSKDLGAHALSRQRVLATAVRLLDTTLIRVGNEEYTRENHSYGLTTLRRRHVKIAGDEVAFHFRGKSGKDRRVSVRDPRVARVVRRCQELPGQELFKYVGEGGELHPIASDDVNAYLREITGDDFTAKDFRTWAATVLAGLALREICGGESAPRSVDKQLVSAVKAVAQVLGNTPAVCRKSYVHPLVLEAHKEGALLDSLARSIARRRAAASTTGLRAEEAAVLSFLRARLRAERRGGAGSGSAATKRAADVAPLKSAAKPKSKSKSKSKSKPKPKKHKTASVAGRARAPSPRAARPRRGDADRPTGAPRHGRRGGAGRARGPSAVDR